MSRRDVLYCTSFSRRRQIERHSRGEAVPVPVQVSDVKRLEAATESRTRRDETRRAACGLRIPLFSAPLLNSTRLNSDLIHLISSLKWPRRSRFPLGQTAVRARDSIAMAIRRHTMLLSARRTRHSTHHTAGSARLGSAQRLHHTTVRVISLHYSTLQSTVSALFGDGLLCTNALECNVLVQYSTVYE